MTDRYSSQSEQSIIYGGIAVLPELLMLYTAVFFPLGFWTKGRNQRAFSYCYLYFHPQTVKNNWSNIFETFLYSGVWRGNVSEMLCHSQLPPA